jgi:hypothetical protein
MTIFTIIQQPGTVGDKLSKAVALAYADDLYDLGGGVWLVADSATAQEVSKKVGITDGINGSGVVVEVASYYGRTNPAVWTWMKAKWEGPTVG